MCFTRRKIKQKKLKQKKLKKNKIKPYVHNENQEFSTEVFLKECLVCHHCKKIFNLGSNEIKINCAGCGEFFHCGISGKCRCFTCTELTIENKEHNQSWCIHCVPPLEGNEEKKNGIGFCKCYQCISE